MINEHNVDNTSSTILCLREAYKYGLTHEVLMSFCKQLNITTDQLSNAMNAAEQEWIK